MTDWRARSMNRIASFTRPTIAHTPSPTPKARSAVEIESLPLPDEIDASVRAFLSNLTNPIHKAPFSPERLTNMFQDFYSGMEELVSDCLPDEEDNRDAGEMFSSEELAQQKVRRNMLEKKRLEWREEIEERVCREMHDKIFELRTSTDELRDEALMSKIIAMNLIGVSLEQLGVGLSDTEWKAMQPTITLIGEELQSLNNAVTPKSKIDILVTCHKQIVSEVQHTNIVDELADAVDTNEDTGEAQEGQAGGQSSEERKHLGADAILPIFIYSIIKSNPAKLVSHFQYIQRFRTVNLLTGESAYCLTNVEAAIGFLETFDNGNTAEQDPLLHVGFGNASLKPSPSTPSLSSTLRAGERARALSSAAQDVYDFADERMKSLGSQFGHQLNALVGRVAQTQDLEDVRSLMGLPAPMNHTEADQPSGIIASPRKNSSSSATSSLRRDIRSSSPSKASSRTSSLNQTSRSGGSLGRLTGFGMIRNLSNSFSASRHADLTKASTPRELQPVESVESSQSTPTEPRVRAASNASSTRALPEVKLSSRFLHMEAEDLTIRDVRDLLADYKRLHELMS